MTSTKALALTFLMTASTSKAANITYLGSDASTKNGWRTTSVAKPRAFDPDGDHAYGSEGFLLVKSTTGQDKGVDSSLPPYVASVDYSTAHTYSSASYPQWDDATLSPGTTVADRRYGLFYNSYSPIDFTLASARKFVLTIPVGGDLGSHYPTSLSLVQTAGGVATGSATKLPILQSPNQVSYLFFQVDGAAGDRFQVNINGGDIGNLSVGGLAWETVTPLDPGTDLVNRWSFNEAAGSVAGGTSFTDSIGAQPAVVVGVGATKNGSALA